MKRAAAIVTDRGGRTCHAAIVSRELGVPCVVGTEHATARIAEGETVTVSCAHGETGAVYRGALPFTRRTRRARARCPGRRTRVMLNVGNPDQAFRLADAARRRRRARAHRVHHRRTRCGVHPMAAAPRRPRRGPGHARADRCARERLRRRRRLRGGSAGRGRGDDRGRLPPAGRDRPPLRLQVQRVRRAARRAATSSRRKRTRCSGSAARIATRTRSYREAFALECRAMRRVREDMGLTNLKLMVPFCRTPAEGRRVIELMAAHGLRRGEHGLEVYVMCEIPSNVHPGAGVRRDLRRVLDRLQRPHPAHARRRPRLRAGRAALRRARSRRAGA